MNTTITTICIRLALGICLAFCVPFTQAAGQPWVQKQAVPGLGRRAAVAFAINGKIYLGGGIDFKDFYEYDPAKNTWTKKSDLPGVATERSFGVGFAINGKGYVGLGFDGIGTGNIKSDFWEYDPSADAWSRKATISGGPKESSGSFVIGGKAYVVGGDNSLVPVADLYEYDPAMDVWTRKAPFPAGGIVSPMTFASGGLGYVCCGRDSAFRLSNAVYAYDPANNSWTRKADFPGAARQAGVGFSINGRGYCGLGGYFSVTHPDLYSYDPAADKWSPESPFTGTGRIFPVAVQTGNSVYLGTGYNNGTDLDDFYEFRAPLSVRGLSPLKAAGVYPVPCTDYICITQQIAAQTGYSICDVSGRVMQQGRLESDRIATGMLPAGTYMLNAGNGQLVSFFQKL